MNRQQLILDFISSYSKKKGYSPTVREIGEAVGLKSSSTVAGHLDRLKKQSLIHWEPYEVRTLRILDPTNMDGPPIVLEQADGVPSCIEWQGRRYVYDPKG